jgi:hypothetical protein
MSTMNLEDRMDSANHSAARCGLVPPPDALAKLFRLVVADGDDPRSRAWETVTSMERANVVDKAMQEICLLNKPRASVTVQITDYIPNFVAEVLGRLSPLARWLLVHELSVDTSIRTLRTMADDSLVQHEGQIGILRSGADILVATVESARAEVAAATTAILQNRRGDVLGSYHLGGARKVIMLHWIPIWLFARRLGVDYTSLLLVTLGHEYAHYYTQLGRDSNGPRGRRSNQHRTGPDDRFDPDQRGQAESADEVETDALEDAFRRFDVHVMEGLAQFYTDRLCRKWIRENEPWSQSPLVAFETLLLRQSEPYTWWSNWGKAPEVVRSAILRARSSEERVSAPVWTEFLELEDTHRASGRGPRR